MISQSLYFWTLVAGLAAFVLKFLVPTFPYDGDQVLALVLFFLGLVRIYPQLRAFGLTGTGIKDLLSSLHFWNLVVGLLWFIVHTYVPTFPLEAPAILTIVLFLLGYFGIYPELRERGLLANTPFAAISFQFKPGIYRVLTQTLRVRGTPSSADMNNYTGISLTIGKSFPVYSVVFDKNSSPWGVITLPGAPQAHYVCLWNMNTLFAEYLVPFEVGEDIAKEVWMQNVHAFLQSLGFKAPAP